MSLMLKNIEKKFRNAMKRSIRKRIPILEMGIRKNKYNNDYNSSNNKKKEYSTR